MAEKLELVALEDVEGVLAASCSCDERIAKICEVCEAREYIRALPRIHPPKGDSDE